MNNKIHKQFYHLMFLIYILFVMYLSLNYIVMRTSTTTFCEGILFTIVISLFICFSLVPIKTLIKKATNRNLKINIPIFSLFLLVAYWLLENVSVILIYVLFIVVIPWLFCYIFFDAMLFWKNESTCKNQAKEFLESLFLGFLFSSIFMGFHFFIFENQFDNIITVENVLKFLVVNLFVNIPHLTVLYINKVQDEREKATE